MTPFDIVAYDCANIQIQQSAKVATLIEKAGFPPGVINVISGHGQTSGAILSSHMDVRALSFTGSCRTGRLIQAAAAKSNLKNVILELGGKSPAVIFEDSNIDKAVAETQNSIQWNSGQVCMANSRICAGEYCQPICGEIQGQIRRRLCR